jgi:hypothetical protein
LKKYFLNSLAFFIIPILSFQQEFNYVHYDTKDGLAGSTVYDMCQDKEGFLWFATESGLSRFDGKNFKNFYVEDGLPDNEILRVFPDSKGRVWIVPFTKTISYYFNREIFNSVNNELLKKVKPESNIIEIYEDEDENIMFADTKKAIFISHDDSVKEVFRPYDRGYKTESIVSVRNNYFDKGFIVLINDSVFYYRNNNLAFAYNFSAIHDRNTIPLITYPKGKKFLLNIPYSFITYETLQNYVKYINTTNGCFLTDTITKSLVEHYLPGKKISRTIEDNEGNIWFATLGEGVYKLPSRETKNITLSKIANPEVFSLGKYKNQLICGLGFSKALLLDENRSYKISDFHNHTISSQNPNPTNRLYCIKTTKSGICFLGFDSYLVKFKEEVTISKDIQPVKSIEEIDRDHLFVGTSKYAFKVRVSDLQIVDTIRIGRCTKVFYSSRKYYVGTLDGLYEIAENKTQTYLGELHPALKRRITDIKEGSDQALYIATADHGIVVFKNGKIITVINEERGLSSNICRSLFLQSNFLLVGTNKGLNKIDISRNTFPIVKYSVSDGLPSDVINAVYAEDSIIWIGTAAGLTYFNEKKISSSSVCNVSLLSITVSGKNESIDHEQRLSYSDNNVTIEYAGISFRSGGDIEYFYKLEGLDKTWNTTRQTSLIYQSLPPGKYEFQLYAVNKFGVQSNTLKFKFSIATPFWKSGLFYGAIILIIIASTIRIVNTRNQRINAKREEQNKIQKQFAALEQQALQAQMNPHFIFNCLNSIQQYILTNDKEKANRYLTGFAMLVRQTLDNSERMTITLEEEISYLDKYLQMEEMRFGHTFDYEITLDKEINAELIEIPALLLQPYVENCLRHGIRYKESGTGKIIISFSIADNVLYCSIKDNGVGRKKAAELKSKDHIEYQSRGMKLTEKRIELLNKINKSSLAVEITDLKTGDGQAAGTEIIVKIPLASYERIQ